MILFENLDKRQFVGDGRYDIPVILPEVKAPAADSFIPVNYAITAKNKQDKTVHFYVDDYQFVRFWNNPKRYAELLGRFNAVCSPDFSLFTDMPVAMQIYNHYRKHWLAAYWQEHGITVYPTISWTTPDSYDWCFDGEPRGALSQCQASEHKKTKRQGGSLCSVMKR